MTKKKPRWLTVQQAARELGMSRQGIHYQIQVGKLKSRRRKIVTYLWEVQLEES